MVRAWYLQSVADDGAVERPPDKEKLLKRETVATKTGVRVYYFKASEDVDEPELLKLKEEIGIRTEDVIVIAKGSPDYEKQSKMFGVEHLHPDDEIRWVVAGVTYFDVRTLDDRWIRVELCSGDMIALPPGIYHKLVLEPDEARMRRTSSSSFMWDCSLA
ncbi:hypothetical protein NP493_466g02018 [Ridgeia piscesae]|uniref:acireductone dioxygenase (Fe(2+)-requiring) n=1 Tax=Ridgeia piscesae TaxID=27915 RepID=A0AAD9NRP3_RIDPI|nr:hypothetical protein NP493_466g02018 [Ridgeia piscesae]